MGVKTKEMRINRTVLTISLISTLTTFGCSPENYTGNWNYTVKDISQGNLKGVFTVSTTETGYNCHVLSSDGMANFDMEECVIIENVFTGYYYDQGTRVDVTGTFEDNTFSGFVNIQGTQMEVKMVRKEE